MTDVVGLTERWAAEWPTTPPIGYLLRLNVPDRWVRFHSLPESKRYPDSPEEMAVVLDRHNTLLSELVETECEGEGQALLVITCAWGDRQDLARDPHLQAVDGLAAYWQSIFDPKWREAWTHLWVSRSKWQAGCLDPLLELVAEDRTADVIVAPDSLAWLYHPYDGGADVIASSVAIRDRLSDEYREWLSTHPTGLQEKVTPIAGSGSHNMLWSAPTSHEPDRFIGE